MLSGTAVHRAGASSTRRRHSPPSCWAGVGDLEPAQRETTQEDAMPIAQMLLPEFDQEVKSTRKLLDCVPDGKFDYKPHEKSMTLGRLAAHVAEMPSYMISTLRLERLDFTGEEKPFAPATRQELLDAFDKNSTEARELLAKATDEELAKVWTLT